MNTNFQKYLDSKYSEKNQKYKSELENLDFASGDFSMMDAKDFLTAVTEKSTAGWAVRTELQTRHSALKKIIDSV